MYSGQLEAETTSYLEDSNRSSGIIIAIMQLGASKALKVYNRSNGKKNADTYIPAHPPTHTHTHTHIHTHPHTPTHTHPPTYTHTRIN